MIEGFFVNNLHSYYTYGLRVLSRNIEPPQKDDCTERVPFSSVTYDFGSVFGGGSYGEGKLTYVLEILCFDRKKAQSIVMDLRRNLKWTGVLPLYDDLLPDFYYEVREPAVSWSENHGIYQFTVVFPTSPEVKRKVNTAYPGAADFPTITAADVILPDVDGDGKVDATDAGMVSRAYGNLSTGRPSGLTPEQEKAADADMDGRIDSSDVSLILSFYSQLSIGNYECTKAGWAKYLNDLKNGSKEVI